jgi:hypothetical protein
MRHGLLSSSHLLRRCHLIIPSREISSLAPHASKKSFSMLIQSASHILRPTTTAFRSSSSTYIFLRHALHSNNVLLRSRVSSVHKFHATSFLSATHRTIPQARRDWRPPGTFQRLIRRLNFIPKSYIIFGILGINGVVFAAWSYVRLFQVRLPCPASPVRREFPGSLCAGQRLQVWQTATERDMARALVTR